MKKRVFVLCLVLSLCISSAALAAGVGEFGEPVPVFAPQSPAAPMQDVAVMASAGTGTVRFTASDFLASLGEDEVLEGVIITSLPVTGRLSLDGRQLLEGEAIPSAALGSLSYLPASVTPSSVSFKVLPVLQSGVGSRAISVNMELRKGENRKPVAENADLKTYKNIPITGYLKAMDPDGDVLEYKITSKPKRGEITMGEGGKFTYVPFNNKTGKDKITYVVQDSFGNLSPEATITIEISKPGTKTTYQDMTGHPGAFAAIRLAEEGVFIGEQVCGQHYFSPASTVTRGEFVAMTLKAIGMDDPAQITVTGFADDKAIPTWVKPYAQAALKAGIINGVASADGRKSFMADKPISMSEAVVLLNNAIRVADVSYTADTVVPTWASQAASNLGAVGILPTALSSEAWSASITRADAAELLCRAMNVSDKSQDNNGLLSWVFGY